MTDRIAFIGVGNMGNPMADQLVKAGKKVKAYDVSQEMIKKAKEANLDVVETLDEVLEDANFIISMLPEGKHVKSLFLGEQGIIDKISKNGLIIDCSTIDIETSLLLGKEAKKRGIKMIDAPVTGGVMGARVGKLNFLVGGDDEAVDLARPLMDIMGQKILHAGPQGSGVGVKICNNMSLGISMIAASEALMLAKRLKMDLKKVHEIMKNASGNNWALSTYTPLPNLTDGVPSNNKYRPGFSAAMMTKDLKLANDAAKSVNASTPLGKHALEIFSEFCNDGESETDYSGKGVDQLANVVRQLKDKDNLTSRRIIMTSWNPCQLDKMALPPCHVMCQFNVSNGTKLSCSMYQRSGDMGLGVPFNIASYSLLLSIFAEILNLKPKKFVHSFGDAHIYLNSVEQVKEQISRKPFNPPKLILPKLNSLEDLSSYSIDDFKLEGYEHHPAIKAKMAV